jgi:hypothetical protein
MHMHAVDVSVALRSQLGAFVGFTASRLFAHYKDANDVHQEGYYGQQALYVKLAAMETRAYLITPQPPPLQQQHTNIDILT